MVRLAQVDGEKHARKSSSHEATRLCHVSQEATRLCHVSLAGEERVKAIKEAALKARLSPSV